MGLKPNVIDVIAQKNKYGYIYFPTMNAENSSIEELGGYALFSICKSSKCSVTTEGRTEVTIPWSSRTKSHNFHFPLHCRIQHHMSTVRTVPERLIPADQ